MLHNDIPSHGEIAALAEVEGPTCITIVTPTEDAPQDYDKARIAFKDQVRSALASVEDPAERKLFEAADACGSIWVVNVASFGAPIPSQRIRARIDAAHEPPDRAVHAPRVAAVQVLEGTHVAARGTAHRVRIGVVGAFRDRRFRTRHGECEGVHPDNIDAPGHAGV